MPLYTPNRTYPYSVPGDPADVPEAIQALAEAIDADATNLESVAGPRAVARVRGITPVTHTGAGATFATLPLELVDFDEGGVLAPLTGGPVQILLPGYYFLLATVVFRSGGPGSTVDQIGFSVIDAANTEVAEASTRTHIFISEGQRMLDAGGSTAVFIPGGDLLFLRSFVNRSAGNDACTFLERTLTLIRMTES